MNKRAIKATINSLAEELARLEALGDDVYENDTVLFFRKQFNDYIGAKVYSYAAIKANGVWYITGSVNLTRLSWSSLAEFMCGEGVNEVWMAKTWERIV